jgi:imidazolonepropionase-like amidohydrolase
MSGHSGMMYDLAIKNARVFDGSSMLESVSIGIAQNKIEMVAASGVSASREIDAAGRFLMPGLIDCHIHLLNMWTATDELTMAIEIASELPKRLNALLAAGVTTVKSVGDSEDDILHVREMLANQEITGPRLFATGAAFAAPGSHPATTIYAKNPWIRHRATVETDSPEQAREAVRRMAAKQVDAIKIVHQGGCRHGTPYFFKAEALGLNVQILKLDKAVLGAIIDETHKHGLKATVHTVDDEAAIEALEAGADGLEHGVMDHEISGDRVIELLLRNHASYVPTLWLLMFDERSADVRYANLKRIADAGVRVVLGTDSFCGYGRFGENTIVELERAAAAGLSPLRILQMATSDAAEHLGTKSVGTIGAGKIADLVLVKSDPTADVSALRSIMMVVKDGKVIIDKTQEANA